MILKIIYLKKRNTGIITIFKQIRFNCVIKTASKQDDEFFVLMSKYDDIPSWACSDVIDFNSAENVNKILKQNGYTNPFYKPGTNVTTIELTEDTTFVRV